MPALNTILSQNVKPCLAIVIWGDKGRVWFKLNLVLKKTNFNRSKDVILRGVQMPFHCIDKNSKLHVFHIFLVCSENSVKLTFPKFRDDKGHSFKTGMKIHLLNNVEL